MKNEIEYWRRIPGFDKYMISSHGRIMGPGMDKIGLQLINPSLNQYGYYKIMILPNGSTRYRKMSIHRLVLSAFKGPPPSDKHVGSHLDDVKTNNHISNLSWTTQRENMQQAILNEKRIRGSAHAMAKLSVDDVKYIRENYVLHSNRRSNTVALAKQFGVGKTTIQRVVAMQSHRPREFFIKDAKQALDEIKAARK